MSKLVVGLILIVLILAAVPFALIARSRAMLSPTLAPHLVLDMDKQAKFKPQRTTDFFEDGRTMRPEVPGVVAREDLQLKNEALITPDGLRMVDGQVTITELKDPSQYAAIVLGRQRAAQTTDLEFNELQPPAGTTLNAPEQKFYVSKIPVPVTRDFMHRGQERFNIYCAPCHGISGYGDGMVARRAAEMQAQGSDAATLWVAPPSYHSAEYRNRPDGSIYNSITNGVRTMPRYDKQISVMDRWAIVAYVRALQESQQGPTTTPVTAGK